MQPPVNPLNPLNPNAPPPPIGGVQAGPAGPVMPPNPAMPNGMPAPAPIEPQQPAEVPMFSGAGAEPYNQGDLNLRNTFAQEDQARSASNASFDADIRRRADETFAEFERSLNPQWEARARQFEQSLVGRGIDPNSEAGRNARAEFDRGRTDAFSQARRAANADGVALQQQRFAQQQAQDATRGQLLQAQNALNAQQSNNQFNRDWQQRQFDEDRRRFDLGFGEDTRRFDTSTDFGQMMDLMRFDQGTTMQNNATQNQDFGRLMQMLGLGMPQGGPVGVDVTGSFSQDQARRQGNANAQQQAQNQNMQAAASIAMMMMMSDMRMKRDIQRVGTLDNGLPVYLFRYVEGVDSGGIHMGVMAQDVEKVHPDAVTEVDGIKMVNYGKAVQ